MHPLIIDSSVYMFICICLVDLQWVNIIFIDLYAPVHLLLLLLFYEVDGYLQDIW